MTPLEGSGMEELAPGEIRRRLDAIADFMQHLPEQLDEKFLRRETFSEVRKSLERQLDETGKQAVDVGASTKRAWNEIEKIKQEMVAKRTVVIVLTLAIAVIAASAAWVSAISQAHR